MHFFMSSGTHGKVYDASCSLISSAAKAGRVGVSSLISLIPSLSNNLSMLAIFLVFRLISPERITLKMGKYSARGEVKY